MRKTKIATCVLLTSALVAAQSPEPVDRVMIARIRAEGLDRSQAGAIYDHLTSVVGPRLTGTPALKGAAEWARDRLAGWGVSDPRLETWDFGRGWELDGFALEMIEPRYMPLTAYPEAWSASTRGVVEGAPIVTGSRSFDEVKAMSGRLAGAIVLTQPIETRFVREDRPPRRAAPRARPRATGRRSITARAWASSSSRAAASTGRCSCSGATRATRPCRRSW